MATTESTKSAVTPIKRPADPYIWGVYILLCVISLIETYSASSREVAMSGVYMPIVRHAVFLLLGAGIVMALQRIPYQRIIRWIPWYALITFILLIWAQFFGRNLNEAQRAVYILGVSIQPAEMAKLGVVLLMAWIMAKNQEPKGVRTRGLVLSSACILMFGVFVFQQGLTNTILLMSINLSMVIISGTQWRKFLALFFVYIALAGAYWALKPDAKSSQSGQASTEAFTSTATRREGTQANRIKRWLGWGDTLELYEKPITDENAQEMYSRLAQANGGVTGVLPGNSRESVELPLAFSDYVYSIIVEDLGLVGGIVVLVLYLWLFSRAGYIAQRCNRALPALLIMGCAVFVVLQALFHMAINVGVFPVSGQPLPLISKGGTSILVISMAFGVMLSVSSSAAMDGNKKESRAELSILPDDMAGANLGQITKD